MRSIIYIKDLITRTFLILLSMRFTLLFHLKCKKLMAVIKELTCDALLQYHCKQGHSSCRILV